MSSGKRKGFDTRKADVADAQKQEVKPAGTSRFSMDAFEEEAIAEAKEKGGIRAVSKHLIDPDPDQPRTEFSEEAMQELIRSIRDHGLLQPIIVRKNGARFMVIAGERRWRASMAIDSVDALDVVVRNDVAPLQILLMQIAENNHRDNMTPMDTARAYLRVKDLCGSQQAAAEMLGVSESQVSITLGLLKSPETIQTLASNAKVRDITTLNLVQRLHRENPEQAEAIVADILGGKIETGGVRKEVKGRLQAAKGKSAATKTADVTRLEATSVDLVEVNGQLILKVVTQRNGYEIVLPAGLETLSALIQKATEEA